MRKFIVIMATITATTTVSAQRIQYPKAQKDGTVDHYFGTEVADPYRWLENDTSQQTAAWVEAENRVTKAYLSKIPFRQKLLKRLTEACRTTRRLRLPANIMGNGTFTRIMGCRTNT